MRKHLGITVFCPVIPFLGQVWRPVKTSSDHSTFLVGSPCNQLSCVKKPPSTNSRRGAVVGLLCNQLSCVEKPPSTDSRRGTVVGLLCNQLSCVEKPPSTADAALLWGCRAISCPVLRNPLLQLTRRCCGVAVQSVVLCWETPFYRQPTRHCCGVAVQSVALCWETPFYSWRGTVVGLLCNQLSCVENPPSTLLCAATR